jgi:hypothetical protein
MEIMLRTSLLLALLVCPALAQYTAEPAGPCNADGVSAAVKGLLEADGVRVKDSSGNAFLELWLRKEIPTKQESEAPRGADFTNIPPTTVLGVIRYAKNGGDFRGQPIQPGAYVFRFNLQPEDGDHQGASPRRDHVLLSPGAADQDPAATLNFDQAMDLSRKASGTRHPLVLFLASPESSAKFPGIHQDGSRQILTVKSGSVAMGIVIVGKAEE